MSLSRKQQSMVRLQFEGRKLEDLDFWTKSDPYLTLNRPSKSGPGFVQIRKTETIRNNLNPKWKLLYIPIIELCDNNFNLPLLIEVFDEDRNSRDDLIGRIQLTLSDLINLSKSCASETLKLGEKSRGQLLVTECQIENPILSEHERKSSMSSYPPIRKDSVNSYYGGDTLSSPNTVYSGEIQHQAVYHEQINQGPICYESPGPSYFSGYPQQQQFPVFQSNTSLYPQLPDGMFPGDPNDTRPSYVGL